MRSRVHVPPFAAWTLLAPLAACCPDPAPRGDCGGIVARLQGPDWSAPPDLTWTVEGTEAATAACDALPAANGEREPCEITFALDEVDARAEIVGVGSEHLVYTYLGIADWPQLPEQAGLRTDWPGGATQEHTITLHDDDVVESGNECPQRCRVGELEVKDVEGG